MSPIARLCRLRIRFVRYFKVLSGSRLNAEWKPRHQKSETLILDLTFMCLRAWLMDNLRVYGHNCFKCNKDTEPSQTCSEGYTFSATATVLYRGVSLFLGSNN